MSDPISNAPGSEFRPRADPTRDELEHQFQDLKRSATSVADGLSHKAEHAAGTIGGDGDRNAARGAAENFRDQAAKTADQAKGAAKSIADQARARMNEILDQQKSAGADKIADVAKAAQSAAADLEQSNPQMARLVKSAAESVDRVASEIRSGDIGTLFDTLSNFGRQQPVAFFGGAVLAGFILSRFFKSDAAVSAGASGFRSVDPA